MRAWMLALVLAACGGSSSPPSDDLSVPEDAAIVATDSGDEADASTVADAATPTCITPATPQACAPPSGATLPFCKLSDTGCMSTSDPTKFTATSVAYEVNTPLWSDNAAKSRAFVLPAGGKIHVKDCTSPSAECTAPNGIADGPAETGKWVLPVGTVLLKNFGFDGKVVETRLLVRVDAATATLFGYGTDWVGFTYAWNEAQTEATITSGSRTNVQFDTGSRTVSWNYPSFIDCVGCHSPAIGPIGTETVQMNRMVGGANQIDTFIAAGLFDSTAPTKPYATPTVEPYVNASLGLTGPGSASLDTTARSYLHANCSYCHRPDVFDIGFDLRYSLSLHDTKICDLPQQDAIPGMTGPLVKVFAPGDHTSSSMWLRMGIAVPSDDPLEYTNVGRMPPVATDVVDQQAVDLVGNWIDSVTTCP